MSRSNIRRQAATHLVTGTAISVGVLFCLSSLLHFTGISQIQLLWPAVSGFGAIALTTIAWLTIHRFLPSVTAQAGWMGIFVVFGQAIDAVSTAVGVDVLSVSEQVPLSRAVLEFASILPTASIIGVGWLFVILKLGLAICLVWLIATDTKTSPLGTRILFLGAGLTGLIPGLRNIILYALS